ncbi:MAG: alpha/beta hydrolase [Verrucomicrobia bacterium]|nr:alpha/beta hydrolase [Verrucomicrobiota bacterium]
MEDVVMPAEPSSRSRGREEGAEGGRVRLPSGCTVYRHVFRPAGKPVAGMLLVHGLGEHLQRYAELGIFLAERGILGIGVDFPGHGRSPGQRGHLPGWDRLVELLDDLSLQLREELADGMEMGLFAHSFGAYLGVDYLARRPGLFRMAWLSSPLVDPSWRQPGWLLRVAGLAGLICPRLPIYTGVRSSECREMSLIGQEAERDPLLHPFVSAGFGSEMLQQIDRVRMAATVLPAGLDLFMTHGSADAVCPASFSRELFETMPCQRKAYHLIPGALHEPLLGERRGLVWEIAGEWMDGLGYPVGPASS